uniref:Nucleotide-diphospho-sugar transferase domain-containing protein n=1 Tax=viral metagenome TaxID=1070528 RepID=A0A6C0I607_9ZZZZ
MKIFNYQKKYNKYIIILLIIIIALLIFLNINYIKNNIYETFNDNNNDINNIILPYDVIIVGCARDIESYLPDTKKKLIMIKSLFRSSKNIIYENDSTDKTLDILKEWEQEQLIQLITEKNIKGIRTERLAYARNILYKEAMKHDFDLLIIVDLDNVIINLTKESIISCFNLKEDWAMVGANQSGSYYDMFALRTYDDWMPFDCWFCIHNEEKSNDYCLNSRMKNIPKDSEPIKVISCFGGTAIYKKKYLDNCSYGNGLQTVEDITTEICEHVDFNKCITNNGGNIYINPKLINY